MLSGITRSNTKFHCAYVFALRLCRAPSKSSRRSTPQGEGKTLSEGVPTRKVVPFSHAKVNYKRNDTSDAATCDYGEQSCAPLIKGKTLQQGKKEHCDTFAELETSEHLSLLSMDMPDEVTSHPILKHINFDLPLNEVDFSAVTHASRFLTALRLCHKFDHGYAFIRLQLAALSGLAIFEAARLLAEAELRQRCVSSVPGELDNVFHTCSDLRERIRSIRLPPPMAVAVDVLLGCVIDASGTVERFSPEVVKHLVFRTDVHFHLACSALYCKNWSQFKIIMKSCPLSPHHSPLLVFQLINYVQNNLGCRKEVLEWYLNALSLERAPLNQKQWASHALYMVRVCGSKASPIKITKNRNLESIDGTKLDIILPKEEPFKQSDFMSLRASLNTSVIELSKGSGSITTKEVSALQQNIRKWSKGSDERAIVIDSLNVFHGNVNGFGPLVSITNRLVSEYNNAVLITRPFLAERLNSMRWRGNVRVFSCTTLSEDDLLVLFAAVEWGPNAYVLSNDRFAVHLDRFDRLDRLSLRDWMRRRIIRFNKQNWRYDSLPDYGEYVQQVAPMTYFVPISEETPGIPLRAAQIVIVGSS